MSKLRSSQRRCSSTKYRPNSATTRFSSSNIWPSGSWRRSEIKTSSLKLSKTTVQSILDCRRNVSWCTLILSTFKVGSMTATLWPKTISQPQSWSKLSSRCMLKSFCTNASTPSRPNLRWETTLWHFSKEAEFPSIHKLLPDRSSSLVSSTTGTSTRSKINLWKTKSLIMSIKALTTTECSDLELTLLSLSSHLESAWSHSVTTERILPHLERDWYWKFSKKLFTLAFHILSLTTGSLLKISINGVMFTSMKSLIRRDKISIDRVISNTLQMLWSMSIWTFKARPKRTLEQCWITETECTESTDYTPILLSTSFFTDLRKSSTIKTERNISTSLEHTSIPTWSQILKSQRYYGQMQNILSTNYESKPHSSPNFLTRNLTKKFSQLETDSESWTSCNSTRSFLSTTTTTGRQIVNSSPTKILRTSTRSFNWSTVSSFNRKPSNLRTRSSDLKMWWRWTTC